MMHEDTYYCTGCGEMVVLINGVEEEANSDGSSSGVEHEC